MIFNGFKNIFWIDKNLILSYRKKVISLIDTVILFITLVYMMTASVAENYNIKDPILDTRLSVLLCSPLVCPPYIYTCFFYTGD